MKTGLDRHDRGVVAYPYRPNKRRSPQTKPGGGDPVLSARPTTFISWWSWGVLNAADAWDVPHRIHDEDRPVQRSSSKKKCPDGACERCKFTGEVKVKAAGAIIVGWPYSNQFEQYVLRKTMGPFQRSMRSMHNPRGWQSSEFQILFALVSGHTDAEVVRAIMGNPHKDFFEEAAVRALEFAYQRVEAELERVQEPNMAAGVA